MYGRGSLHLYVGMNKRRQDPQVSADQYFAARAKTKDLARAGIFTGLSWLCLILAVVLPHVSLSFRIVASFLLLAAVLGQGLKAGSLIFLTTNLLNLAYPGFFLNMPYTVYFGPYVLLAFLLTKLSQRKWLIPVRIGLGTLLFASLGLIYGRSLFPADLVSRWLGPGANQYFWPLVFLAGLLVTCTYDYLLALVSLLYRDRLAKYVP